MTLLDVAIYFMAGFAGSAINAVAGGGTFLTFPLLIFNGMSALQANIMSTIALWPGSVASAYAYRAERNIEQKKLIKFIIISIIGSIMGTATLLLTPEQMFERLVPWLLLFATLLFAFGRRLRIPSPYQGEGQDGGYISGTTRNNPQLNRPPDRGRRLLLLQFFIALYGGYFGAGIGILMLAMLQLTGFTRIHQMNALKTILGSTINAAAVLVFLFSGQVVWPVAVVMIIGALAGGYAGARLALKVAPERVRLAVCAIGFAMTGYFFLKVW